MQPKQRKGGRATGQSLKSNLTKPADSWGTAVYREGLSIRQLTPEEVEEKERIDKLELPPTDKLWTVQYSKRYRSVTRAFVNAVMTGDPERFYRILAELPWHGDTLLQMSEVCRHREGMNCCVYTIRKLNIYNIEHATTVDYLSRALFTYERSLMGAFAFTAGINRLDFDRVENRPFFLAVSRMMTCVYYIKNEYFDSTLDSGICSVVAVQERLLNLLGYSFRLILMRILMAHCCTSTTFRYVQGCRSGYCRCGTCTIAKLKQILKISGAVSMSLHCLGGRLVARLRSEQKKRRERR